MRIIDVHLHTAPEDVSASEMIKAMDASGVAKTLVITRQERSDLAKMREQIVYTSKVIAEAPDRLGGLAFIQPTIPGAADLAAEALNDMGYIGLKMMPDHWYPYEERLEPFWEKMNDAKASILFHTGILWANEDSSRFCRPVYLEKLYHYPDIRFTMAHISWPWCEECIAVLGRLRAAEKRSGDRRPQCYIDLTPGTPRHIRKQAIANAFDYCGDRLMFGTDCRTSNMARQKDHIDRDLAIFDELGLTPEQKERIMSGAADELFPVR